MTGARQLTRRNLWLNAEEFRPDAFFVSSNADNKRDRGLVETDADLDDAASARFRSTPEELDGFFIREAARKQFEQLIQTNLSHGFARDKNVKRKSS